MRPSFRGTFSESSLRNRFQYRRNAPRGTVSSSVWGCQKRSSTSDKDLLNESQVHERLPPAHHLPPDSLSIPPPLGSNHGSLQFLQQDPSLVLHLAPEIPIEPTRFPHVNRRARDRIQQIEVSAPGMHQEPGLPLGVVVRSLMIHIRTFPTRRFFVKPAEEKVLRKDEELAVQAELREKTEIGRQLVAYQGRPHHGRSPDHPKVHMAQRDCIEDPNESSPRRVFQEVEVVVIVFDKLPILFDQPRLGVAGNNIRLPIQHGNALLNDRGIPVVVCGRPLVVLAAAQGEYTPEVAGPPEIPLVAHVPDPLVLRRKT